MRAALRAAELARLPHVPANRIAQILADQRAITADTALRLGRWCGTGPELRPNPQQMYALRLAEWEVE